MTTVDGRTTDRNMADQDATETPQQSGIARPDWLTHPAVRIAAVLVLAPALFLMARQIGATLYAATDGEPMALVVIGVGFGGLVSLVVVGAWVDTRRERSGGCPTRTDHATMEDVRHVGT